MSGSSARDNRELSHVSAFSAGNVSFARDSPHVVRGLVDQRQEINVCALIALRISDMSQARDHQCALADLTVVWRLLPGGLARIDRLLAPDRPKPVP